jgi:hypothetical protein
VEANSTGGQGLRRAVAPSVGDENTYHEKVYNKQCFSEYSLQNDYVWLEYLINMPV